MFVDGQVTQAAQGSGVLERVLPAQRPSSSVVDVKVEVPDPLTAALACSVGPSENLDPQGGEGLFLGFAFAADAAEAGAFHSGSVPASRARS